MESQQDSDFSIRHERLCDQKTYSDFNLSYFKQKPVILTFGLLAISYILVIALFTSVLSQNPRSEPSDLARRSDLLGLNSSVDDLATKVKQIERDVKKVMTCDFTWVRFECSCYYFSSIRSDWKKARAMCIGKNSDLAVITSAKEQKFISDKTKSLFYWIGLNDIVEEGKWKWVDGTDSESSYKFWKTGEPNDEGKNEDCALVGKDGEWNDKPCDYDKIFAICEKPL